MSEGLGVRWPRFERVAILAEGALEVENAKTAVGIIRYGRCRTVAVIDSQKAGRDVGDAINVGHGIPVVASLAEALRHHPQSLVIGIAPRGGKLPEEWRTTIIEAIDAGLDVVSGLHSFLADDADIAARAAAADVVIADVRKPPPGLMVSEGRCRDLPQNIVLTVGTDCSVGKMSVSLELDSAARKKGLRSEFVATGQTGILIWGKGIAVDACVGDFMAGATERMVLEAAVDADWVFVEGQGSLYHPGYSGVTHGLMYGCAPKQMVLCHQPSRRDIRGYGIKIPPLSEAAAYHEQVLNVLFPTKVSCVALNTYDLSESEAREAISLAEADTGLPADDCVRFGAEKLLAALTG